MRDQTDERNARADIDPFQDRFEDIAADIIEVDVDALGTRDLERFLQIFLFVIDAGVESEVLDDVGTLLVRARRSDDPAAFDICTRALYHDAAPLIPVARMARGVLSRRSGDDGLHFPQTGREGR